MKSGPAWRILLVLAALCAIVFVAVKWFGGERSDANTANSAPTSSERIAGDEAHLAPASTESAPAADESRSAATPATKLDGRRSSATRDAATGERRARIVGRLVLGEHGARRARYVHGLVFDLDPSPNGALVLTRSSGGLGVVHASKAAFDLDERAPLQLALDDGRFELTLPESTASARRELRVRVIDDRDGERNAWVELPLSIDGELDVGTLVLDSGVELASGTVVDGAGNPAARVLVSADPEGVDAPTEEERFPGARASITDDAGAFVVRGNTSARTLRLSFAAHGQPTRHLDGVRVGKRDLRFQLDDARKGSLAARVLLDDPALLGHVLARLVRRSDGVATEPKSPRDGRIEFKSVDAGEYELRISLRPLDDVVTSIPELQIFDGRVCADSRLDPIDLRGAIDVSEVLLRRADGTPVVQRMVGIERAGAIVFAITDRDGALRVPFTGTLPNLNVVAGPGKLVPFRHGEVVIVE